VEVVRSRKILLDTNVFIGWLNDRRDEGLAVGRGFVRYLSAVVLMELRIGAGTARSRRQIGALLRAYDARARTVAPDRAMFEAAGDTLRRLKAEGREIRRSSLVSDVLIAHTARSLGAAVVTRDTAFEAIRAVLDFDLDLLAV
jgi:predicted nucleic acid-binding protein